MVGLQREYPKLDITVSKTWKGQSLIRPLSNDTQFLLYNMRSLRGKPIAFLQMDARQHFLTAILCKVPHALTEELLEEVVPEIAKATRLTCWSAQMQDVVPTMSVKILWRGDHIPYKVKVGFLGRFATKSFTPEPNQCYKCLSFGHIGRVCTASHARCRLCRENHPSKQCQDRRDRQEEVKVKCANCQAEHAASSLCCPKRKEIAQALIKRNPALPQPGQVRQRIPVKKDFPPEPKINQTAQAAQTIPIQGYTTAVKVPVAAKPQVQKNANPTPVTNKEKKIEKQRLVALQKEKEREKKESQKKSQKEAAMPELEDIVPKKPTKPTPPKQGQQTHPKVPIEVIPPHNPKANHNLKTHISLLKNQIQIVKKMCQSASDNPQQISLLMELQESIMTGLDLLMEKI